MATIDKFKQDRLDKLKKSGNLDGIRILPHMIKNSLFFLPQNVREKR